MARSIRIKLHSVPLWCPSAKRLTKLWTIRIDSLEKLFGESWKIFGVRFLLFEQARKLVGSAISKERFGEGWGSQICHTQNGRTKCSAEKHEMSQKVLRQHWRERNCLIKIWTSQTSSFSLMPLSFTVKGKYLEGRPQRGSFRFFIVTTANSYNGHVQEHLKSSEYSWSSKLKQGKSNVAKRKKEKKKKNRERRTSRARRQSRMAWQEEKPKAEPHGMTEGEAEGRASWHDRRRSRRQSRMAVEKSGTGWSRKPSEYGPIRSRFEPKVFWGYIFFQYSTNHIARPPSIISIFDLKGLRFSSISGNASFMAKCFNHSHGLLRWPPSHGSSLACLHFEAITSLHSFSVTRLGSRAVSLHRIGTADFTNSSKHQLWGRYR